MFLSPFRLFGIILKHDPQPVPGIRSGARGPRVWGDPEKYPTSGFLDSEFFFTISNARWSLRKLGPNSRLAGVILPKPEKKPKLSRAFRESRWSYLVKIKNLHTSHIYREPQILG